MDRGKHIQTAWDDFIHSGSEQAYYVLYNHYHDYLLYVAVQKGVSIELAKDKVNDLFLYVFENRSKLDAVNHFHNYIVTSFLNNLFRKEAFSAESISAKEETIADEQTFPVSDFFITGRSTDKQVSQALKAYINKLSYSQAKMVYQKFYLGLSYEEIARAKGVSVKTVYNTLLRALARLRDIIGEESAGSLKAAVFSLGNLLLLEVCVLLLLLFPVF